MTQHGADGAVAASSGQGLRYSFAALDRLRRGLEAEEAWWDDYFDKAGVRPLVIHYEEFAGQHDRAVRAVLRHLEIPFEEEWALPSPAIRRQADTLSEEWVARYAQDLEAVGAPEPA